MKAETLCDLKGDSLVVWPSAKIFLMADEFSNKRGKNLTYSYIRVFGKIKVFFALVKIIFNI